jgi:hypothetical protein
MGGQTYHAYIEDITIEQNRTIDLDLAFGGSRG